MAAVAHWLRVLEVEHYTPSYFRFRVERPEGLRFESGQFIMVGLEIDGRPLMRAYSIASAPWDDGLEFYSIIIPEGRLTSRLRHIQVGDQVGLSARAVGTLTLDNLRDGGERLFMLSTGTGVAPFASLIRDEETYERFGEVYLTQTCRNVEDLQYAEQRVALARACPLVGDEASEKLRFYGTVTRQPHTHQGRITDLLASGKLTSDLGIPPLDPERDRVMICGSLEMLNDTRRILEELGFKNENGHRDTTFTWEKAFSG